MTNWFKPQACQGALIHQCSQNIIFVIIFLFKLIFCYDLTSVMVGDAQHLQFNSWLVFLMLLFTVTLLDGRESIDGRE